jgi:excisionase family DNA binding protein
MTTNKTSVPRLALSKKEAAEALGISIDHLERHILPELRVAYIGSRRLIPTSELQRYLNDNAHRVLDT